MRNFVIRWLIRPWFVCAAGLALRLARYRRGRRPPREGNGSQQFGDIGDFKLVSGQVLRGCRIGYRAFGRLDPANRTWCLFPPGSEGAPPIWPT